MSDAVWWDYRRDNKWAETESKCGGKKQSPINIDTNIFDGYKNRCDIRCELGLKYEPSECHITNKADTPTVYFDSGSYIKFNGHLGSDDPNYNFSEDGLFELKKATFHTPSMHTINNLNYDLEVMLYHYSLSDILKTKLESQINRSESSIDFENESKGVIISLFFKKGHDRGAPNEFFSQFMNRFPNKSIERDINIPVNKDWSPKMLIPENKSYFTYAGSLPYPPCNQNWYYIVFEEVGIISKHLFEAFELVFKNNKRTTQKLNNRSVSYNSNATFNRENEQLILEMTKEINELKKKKEKLIKELPSSISDKLSKEHKEKKGFLNFKSKKDKKSEKCENNNNNNNNNNNTTSLFDEENNEDKKQYTKHLIMFIIFILCIVASYFIAVFFIATDRLPNFLNSLVSSSTASSSASEPTSQSNNNNLSNNNISNND